MTTWSGTDNGLQVGVDLSSSDASPSYGESITITCKWYIKSANRWNDTETLHWSFNGNSGTKTFTNSVDGSSQLLLTKTATVTADNSSSTLSGHGDISGAYNGASPSITDSITVPAVGGAPDAPTGFSVTSVTSSAVGLDWTASHTNGSPVTSYAVMFGVVGSGTWVTRSAGSATSFTVTGLSPDTAYDFKVFARSNAGPSPTTPILTRTTDIGDPDDPTQVSINDTSTATTFQVNLTWKKGATNGASFTSYDALSSKYTNGSQPYATSLTSALSTSGSTTSLPIAPLPHAMIAGDTVTTVTANRNSVQVWTLLADALVGDTSLSVSAPANFAYPSGTAVLLGSTFVGQSGPSSPSRPAEASTTYYGWVRVASLTPSYTGSWISGGSVVTGASGGQGDLVDRISAFAAQVGQDMSDHLPRIGTGTVSASTLAAGGLVSVNVSYGFTMPSTPRAVVPIVTGFVSGSSSTVLKTVSALTTTDFNVILLNTGDVAATFTGMPIVFLIFP